MTSALPRSTEWRVRPGNTTLLPPSARSADPNARRSPTASTDQLERRRPRSATPRSCGRRYTGNMRPRTRASSAPPSRAPATPSSTRLPAVPTRLPSRTAACMIPRRNGQRRPMCPRTPAVDRGPRRAGAVPSAHERPPARPAGPLPTTPWPQRATQAARSPTPARRAPAGPLEPPLTPPPRPPPPPHSERAPVGIHEMAAHTRISHPIIRRARVEAPTAKSGARLERAAGAGAARAPPPPTKARPACGAFVGPAICGSGWAGVGGGGSGSAGVGVGGGGGASARRGRRRPRRGRRRTMRAPTEGGSSGVARWRRGARAGLKRARAESGRGPGCSSGSSSRRRRSERPLSAGASAPGRRRCVITLHPSMRSTATPQRGHGVMPAARTAPASASRSGDSTSTLDASSSVRRVDSALRPSRETWAASAATPLGSLAHSCWKHRAKSAASCTVSWRKRSRHAVQQRCILQEGMPMPGFIASRHSGHGISDGRVALIALAVASLRRPNPSAVILSVQSWMRSHRTPVMPTGPSADGALRAPVAASVPAALWRLNHSAVVSPAVQS